MSYISAKNQIKGTEVKLDEVQAVEPVDLPEKERENKKWIQSWSDVLHEAINLTGTKSFKAVVSAALDSGWDLWQPLEPVKNRGFYAECYPLPVILADFWTTEKEGRFNANALAHVKGLSALGVDWNKVWFNPQDGKVGMSPMQKAASKRNWAMCEALQAGGARWMGGAEPGQSALALLFSQFHVGPAGDLEANALDSRKRAWTELESACAQGLADPEIWMPVALLAELASRVMERASYDSVSKKERVEARAFWKEAFERASKLGCHRWDKPISFGENIPDWARHFNLKMKNFTLPMALAEWALCAPEAWEAAMNAPGFKVDPRSGWGLSSRLAWDFKAGNDFKLRLKWSKQTAENLKHLNPWRDAFISANELPELDREKYRSNELLEGGGWGWACAALLAKEYSGDHEDGKASGIHLKAQRALLSQLAELVIEIAAWCKAKPGEANGSPFKEEFGAELARMAVSNRTVDFTMEGPKNGARDRVVADGPRVALAAIGQLIPACAGAGFELALAAHKALAGKIKECLAEGKVYVAHQFDEEICVEEMARQSAGLPWESYLGQAVQEWVVPMASAYRRALENDEPEVAAKAGLSLAWIEAFVMQVPEAPVCTKKHDGFRL